MTTEDPRPDVGTLVADLVTRYRSGELVCKVDSAAPWLILDQSRASFYRALAAGQIPGTLRLGAGYRLQLGPLLKFVGALPDESCGGCQR